MNRFNTLRQFRPLRGNRFQQAGDDAEPTNYIDVSGGDPVESFPEPVDWTSPLGATSTQSALPYDADGRYTFEHIGGDFDMGHIDWRNTLEITDMKFGELESAGNLIFLSMNNLTRFRAPNLQTASLLYNGAGMAEWSTPSLISCNNAYLTYSTGCAFDFSSLTTANGILLVDNCSSFIAPNLQTCNSTLRVKNSSFASLNLPSLQTVSVHLDSRVCTSLTTVDLSSLQTVGGELVFLSCTNLASVNIDSLTTANGIIYFQLCALPESEVDYILGILATNNGGSPVTSTAKNVNISGGTNAAPSATGEAHIDTLRADGWTVTVTGGY